MDKFALADDPLAEPSLFQEKRMKPVVQKRILLAILAVALFAASCAPLPRESQKKQFLVQKLITDVETAIQAIAAYYDNKQGTIKFAESSITVNTEYVKTTQGEIKAVISVSGSNESTSGDSLVIKLGALSAPLRQNQEELLQGFTEQTKNAISGKDIECGDPNMAIVTVAENGSSQPDSRSVPEQLALLAISGANGYVCAVKNGAKLNLDELAITVGFNVVQTATGGLEIEFSPVTLGATGSLSYTHGHSIVMKFHGK
jgi:hypothetical protein